MLSAIVMKHVAEFPIFIQIVPLSFYSELPPHYFRCHLSECNHYGNRLLSKQNTCLSVKPTHPAGKIGSLVQTSNDTVPTNPDIFFHM